MPLTIAVTLLSIVAAAALSIALFTVYVYLFYSKFIDRIFDEKPLLLADKGEPITSVETVSLATRDGRRIVGSYLKHTSAARRGVVLFLHEYGATRWLANSYAGFLRDDGFDVFTIDFCCHGESDAVPGYEPLHWPTSFEVDDALAAIDYLRTRPDAHAGGIAVFGVSKGGGAGIVAAAKRPYVRAVVTDGAFPVFGMVVHFAMKWIEVYSTSRFIYKFLPRWFYGVICWGALRRISRQKRVRYPSVERGLRHLAGRPLLMIVGQRDSYVRKEVAEALFAEATQPKELWFVKRAKHNGCLDTAGDEYKSRVREFLVRSFPAISSSSSSLSPPHAARERRAS